MKLKMNENSIFAVLLRSPWWMSAGIAAALFTAARLVLPAEYGPYAFFAALPFFVIAGYLGWQQLRAPSEARITRAMDALRALAWTEFSAAVEEAFRREGYSVARIAVAGADLELTKAGRVTLVACKRWKVVRTGIEPLRELDSARQARDAPECIYIATGEVTDNARAFATEKKIRLLHGAELAKLLPLGAARSARAGSQE
jgi:restriction system protein